MPKWHMIYNYNTRKC